MLSESKEGETRETTIDKAYGWLNEELVWKPVLFGDQEG
jgi:hypothetical protein